MLHEMMVSTRLLYGDIDFTADSLQHAYYNIICGHYNRVDHGPVFREAMLAVDRRWRYCFRLRAIKYVDGLIEGIDGVD